MTETEVPDVLQIARDMIHDGVQSVVVIVPVGEDQRIKRRIRMREIRDSLDLRERVFVLSGRRNWMATDFEGECVFLTDD